MTTEEPSMMGGSTIKKLIAHLPNLGTVKSRTDAV